MIGSKRKRETVFASLRASGVAEEKIIERLCSHRPRHRCGNASRNCGQYPAQIIQVRAQRDRN
jgi:hypothetical protein